MLRAFVATAVLLSGACAALADEVIIRRSAPVEVVTPPPPPPHEVVIERRAPDCRTTRTHTEDEDTGESTTVTRQSCD